MKYKSQKKDWASLLFILLLTNLLVFSFFIIKKQYLWGCVDFAYQGFPFKYYAGEVIKSGTLPYWNHYIFSGSPFLANFTTGIFYPFSILYLFFSPLLAFHIILFFNFLLVGFFTYIFLREYVPHFIALIITLSFTYSNYFFKFVGALIAFDTKIWVPLMFFFITKALGSKNKIYLLILILLFTLQILAGDWEILFYSLISLIIYILILPLKLQANLPEKFYFIVLLFLTLIFATGISSLQILPGITLINKSTTITKNLPLEKRYQKPNQGLSYFPAFFDYYFASGNKLGGIPRLSFKHSAYSGILLFFLMPLGLFLKWKKPLFKAFFILIVTFLFFIFFPTTIFDKLFINLSPFYPTGSRKLKIIILLGSFIPLISALSLKSFLALVKLLNFKIKKKITYLIIVFYGIIFSWFFLSAITVYNIKIHSWGNISFQYFFLKESSLFFIFFTLIALTFFLYLYYHLNYKQFKKFLFLIIFFSLFFNPFFRIKNNNNDFVYFTTVPSNFFNQQPTYVNKIKNQQNLYLIYDFYQPEVSRGTVRNLGMLYNISNAGGYNSSLNLPQYNKILSQIKGITDEENLPEINTFLKYLKNKKILEFLGVRYLLLNKGTDSANAKNFKVYKIKNNALPLVKIFSKVKISNNNIFPEINSLNFNFQKTLLLNSQAQYLKTKIQKLKKNFSSKNINKISSIKIFPNSIKIKLKINSPCFLLFRENYYPGWQVKVNNKKQNLVSANYIYSAVFLKKGTQQVIFSYKDSNFLRGFILSISFLVAFTFILINYFLKNKVNFLKTLNHF